MPPASGTGGAVVLDELRALGRADQVAAIGRLSGGTMADVWLITYADGTEVVGKTATGAGPGLFAAEADGLAVVYAHGGGMIGGSLDLYDEVVSWYVSQTGVPLLSVGYRLAPEATSSTTLAEDVFTGLTWLAGHASGLGADPARIAVMGDSGGGPAAAAAILARDRDVPLARQILIYPMLGDRNTTPGPVPPGLLTWTYDNNFTGWHALLGDEIGTEKVSPIAAPGRLTDFTGLAPAYIEVGDLDIFRDEAITYAGGLASAGVPVELHVHPGAPHGFERFVPDAAVAQRAMADRARAIAAI